MFLRSLLLLLSAAVSATNALSLARFGLVASFPPRNHVHSAEIAASTSRHVVATDVFMPFVLFVFGTAAAIVVIILIGRPAPRDVEPAPSPPRGFARGIRGRPRRPATPQMEEAINDPVHGNKNSDCDWLIAVKPGMGGRRLTG